MPGLLQMEEMDAQGECLGAALLLCEAKDQFLTGCLMPSTVVMGVM